MDSKVGARATLLIPSDTVADPPVKQPEFREIYQQHFRFVWRALRRLGVNEADVADAVQDVFIVVHAKLADFEGRSKMTTWLFGICLRVARDRRKRAHVRSEVVDEAAVAAQADERSDVYLETERRQGLSLLERIFEDMPTDQRVVFGMFELEGMTGEQISQMLDVPLGTVYSRLRLARDAFRRTAARLQARARSQELGKGFAS